MSKTNCTERKFEQLILFQHFLLPYEFRAAQFTLYIAPYKRY